MEINDEGIELIKEAHRKFHAAQKTLKAIEINRGKLSKLGDKLGIQERRWQRKYNREIMKVERLFQAAHQAFHDLNYVMDPLLLRLTNTDLSKENSDAILEESRKLLETFLGPNGSNAGARSED